MNLRGGLYPIYLRAPVNVSRALTIPCPICQARTGTACQVDSGKPVVHDARESVAFHGKKIWV
jgi:hypothetical protein